MATTAIEILKSKPESLNAKNLIVRQFKTECLRNYRLLDAYREPFKKHRTDNLKIIAQLTSECSSTLVAAAEDLTIAGHIKNQIMTTLKFTKSEEHLNIAEILGTRIDVMKSLAEISLDGNDSTLIGIRWNVRVKNLRKALEVAMDASWSSAKQSGAPS